MGRVRSRQVMWDIDIDRCRARDHDLHQIEVVEHAARSLVRPDILGQKDWPVWSPVQVGPEARRPRGGVLNLSLKAYLGEPSGPVARSRPRRSGQALYAPERRRFILCPSPT